MDLVSNKPFWLIKNGLVNAYPGLRTSTSCDVLVVGGGITGSLIAHQCIADGHDTILIDKREVANGSSAATTSMLQYEIDTPLHQLIDKIGERGARASYEACAEAICRLEAIADQIKSKAGFKQKDSLYFASYKKDTAWLRQEFLAREKAGFEVKWMEANEIEKAYRLLGSQGGILSSLGASVDAFMLVHELLAYNQPRGLRVYDRTEAKYVEAYARHNLVTLSTGATIKAKRIIYCVGYESVTMIKERFVNLISTYAIVSEVESELSAPYTDLLLWNTTAPYSYMRTTDDGRMLIGGEDEEFVNAQRRDALIAKKKERLANIFAKHLPHIPFRTDFAWAGTFGTTKDGLPYIGRHPDFRHSYFVLGFGGNGITFSVTGMDMASAWLAGKRHALDEWFAFGR